MRPLFYNPYAGKIWSVDHVRAQDKGLFYTLNIFVLFIDKRVLLTKGNFSKFF